MASKTDNVQLVPMITQAELPGRRIESEILTNIFDFLARNRSFNCQVQHVAYAQSLRQWGNTYTKIAALLHAVAGTQAIGSLDGLAKTWKRLHENQKVFKEVKSADQLAIALKLLIRPTNQKITETKGTYEAMWAALSRADGFGPKTAALFVKAILDVHTVEINTDLRFLDTSQLSPSEYVYVPVDSVITYIFQLITGENMNFHAINEVIRGSGLRDSFQPTLWDDLWFWGFITQHGGGENRRLAVNESKFWSIFGAPKHQWNEISTAAEEFITMLKSSSHASR